LIVIRAYAKTDRLFLEEKLISKNSIGFSDIDDSTSAFGRLKKCKNEWENIRIDVYIRTEITQGYKLSFKTLPNNCILNRPPDNFFGQGVFTPQNLE
jgi:hypothetical protein